MSTMRLETKRFNLRIESLVIERISMKTTSLRIKMVSISELRVLLLRALHHCIMT